MSPHTIKQPHQPWIPLKRFRGCESSGFIIPPHPPGATEGVEAGGGAEAGTAEGEDAGGAEGGEDGVEGGDGGGG